MAHTHSEFHVGFEGRSRRKGPRIEIMGQLHGQVVAMNIPLVVLNLGTGGFGVESDVAFPVGAVHQFRFTTQAGDAIVVKAQVRYCRQSSVGDGPARHRAGFAFVHEHGDATVQAVEALLDAATSVLMFQ